ncbi:Uncharacterised protein [Sphingobacterium spiritivorum]|uniref:Uncharacterized protein n=1 Tax=Sphingobacterium spiritivorum TaxID=258 RepID=A0A380BWL7_SPHSI|nr:Uncharacterised protein [Sphingobacterium spiritivorum]
MYLKTLYSDQHKVASKGLAFCLIHDRIFEDNRVSCLGTLNKRVADNLPDYRNICNSIDGNCSININF